MPLINWSTVWTAGATALFVTLAVEYAAKPRLEARKERILDALRARVEIKALVTRMSLAAMRYVQDLPDGVDPQLRADWNKERKRQFAVLEELALKMSDEVPRYAGNFRQPLLVLVQDFAYNVLGIMMSGRQRTRKAEMLVELGPPMLAALDFPAPWKVWRLSQWQQAVNDVRRLIAQAQEQGERK